MRLNLGGIYVHHERQALERYCLHWESNYTCHFGSLPTVFTGNMPCITRVPTRAKRQHHAMKCTCGQHEIVRPE